MFEKLFCLTFFVSGSKLQYPNWLIKTSQIDTLRLQWMGFQLIDSYYLNDKKLFMQVQASISDNLTEALYFLGHNFYLFHKNYFFYFLSLFGYTDIFPQKVKKNFQQTRPHSRDGL
jgi:hypothetical protein